jgi:hypothetical protein
MAIALRTAARVLPVKQVRRRERLLLRLSLLSPPLLFTHTPLSHIHSGRSPTNQTNPQARCIVPVGRVARPAVFTRSVAAKAPESATYANEEKARARGARDRTRGGAACMGLHRYSHHRHPPPPLPPSTKQGPKDSLDYRVFFKTNGTTVSPWHDIPLYAGEGGLLNFVCEIPKETSAKMECATDEPNTPIKQDTKKGKLRFYPYNINWK